jgi:hypothetical protein
MKWQKSNLKDTNANDADTPGYLATKRNILMFAPNAKAHIGISPVNSPRNNIPSLIFH